MPVDIATASHLVWQFSQILPLRLQRYSLHFKRPGWANMASLSPSFSLLHGPTARLLHRSSQSESFHILNDNAPLRMLNYFSSAVRSRLPRSLQCICNGYGPVPACLLHGLAFQRPQAPSATVQIAGGDYSAHIDLIKWMASGLFSGGKSHR